MSEKFSNHVTSDFGLEATISGFDAPSGTTEETELHLLTLWTTKPVTTMLYGIALAAGSQDTSLLSSNKRSICDSLKRLWSSSTINTQVTHL